MIRIAFFDIDNTLVAFGSRKIEPSARAALDALREAGVKIFISSGRHKCVMSNLGGYPFDGYICVNGGLVMIGDEYVFRHPIPRQDSVAIARAMRENAIPLIIYIEAGVRMSFSDANSDRMLAKLCIPLPQLTDIERMAQEVDIYQFTPFLKKGQEKILDTYPSNTLLSRWNDEFVDLNPADVTKATGMQEVMAHYGFSREESIAFGDGGNDIQMLQYAGIGVAMGNATPDVKEMADFVTTSVDDGGVAGALRHFGIV
ncbi:MAG: Cof-type HAD-IIB family hydrolase [Bacteroidales bacterium]|nr:Cof-type HAD-IIB family hydrolase [Bacteroidales bacterium]